jgi:hypothetical protein
MPSPGEIIRAVDVSVQACRVTRAAAQSIPDNVITTVAFDEERFDTDGMHNVVTNNSRITINTAGIYIVGFNGILQSDTYVTSFALLRVNGTTEIARGSRQYLPSTLQSHIQVQTVYQFVAGDYIEVQVYHDNPGNIARNLDATDERTPEFYAARIGS